MELENISEIIFVNKVDLVFVIKLLITIQCYDSSTETFIRREEGQIKRRHKSVDYTRTQCTSCTCKVKVRDSFRVLCNAIRMRMITGHISLLI